MAYTAQYNFKETITSDGRIIRENSLLAKFYFWGQTSPEKRESIKKRIQTLESKDIPPVYISKDKRYDIVSHVYTNTFALLRLRFNIEVKSIKCDSFEGLIDLPGIDHFICTGIPKIDR